jgi:hypothetical protein
MKKMFFLLTLLILITFVPGVMAIPKPTPEPAPEASTSTPPGRPPTEKTGKFSGIIERVDERLKTIVVKGKMIDGGNSQVFVIDSKTKIAKGKTAMTFEDLRKDMQVSVEYRKEMNKMIAMTIDISAPKSTPK